MRDGVGRSLAGAALVLLSAVAAAAQPAGTGGDQARGDAAQPAPPAGLFGDIGGVRPVLDRFGITLGLSEESEVLGNLTGGVRRGAEYDGLTTVSLTIDTGKALDWAGGTLYASALQIHGRNLTADNLLSLQTVSGIAAARSTRLWELWFQQELPGTAADLKIGQQSLDQEFITSQYAALYVNAALGWPGLPANDLYAGGPDYPLSAVGVRLRVKPTDALSVLAGVFDDNPPAGPFFDDSQLRGSEKSGTRFNLGTGALVIGEVQYAVPRPFFAADPAADLPGTYKLGAWIDTGRFPDQLVGVDGLSLANPASSGTARFHKGNFSVYAVIDQMVWRETGGSRNLAVFTRAMGAPATQNLVNWGLNAGLNLKAPLRGRDADTVGVAYGWVHVSPRASAFDRDSARFGRTDLPVRSSEQFIEITYQCQIAPWWVVQPDLQYIVNPGGGIPNPTNPATKLGNELVLGLRTIVTF